MNKKRENKSPNRTNSPGGKKGLLFMALFQRAFFPHVAIRVLFLSLVIARPAWADDLTGAPHDDPKDLLPPVTQDTSSSSANDRGFLPLPSWARGQVMPPLPQALKPMGKKVVVLTTPPVAAPQPLAPPKDTSAPKVTTVKPTPPAPPSAPAPTPALIAVSPFLEWIKSNPQAASEQARLQASTYTAGSDANAAAPTMNANGTPSGNGNPPSVSAAQPPAPYWLPPLIDSATFGTSSGGSSAAIYTTPQR
jgi:hypothetical protein